MFEQPSNDYEEDFRAFKGMLLGAFVGLALSIVVVICWANWSDKQPVVRNCVERIR